MSEPTFEELEKGIHYKYWNCPVKFIPSNIIKFFCLYDHVKQFPNVSMPTYDNTSSRFLFAIRYYETQYNEALQMKRKMEGK